jgi:hypothetical protein
MPEDASKGIIAQGDVAQRWGGRVPIVIGAIGHRNIRPADGKLAAAVRGECRKLKKEYNSSPFVVLSALAEGADRLIAQTAMEKLGADLIAVLPMPAADYERDFETEDSKAEFRAFLERAICVKIARLPAGDEWKVDGEPRNEQYARAGAMIVDHTQILFAIWDGQPKRGTGGTAQQAEWFAQGSSPEEYALHKTTLTPLTAPEPGLLICIDPSNALVSLGDTGQQSGNGGIRPILQRTNTYNHDVARHPDAIAKSYPLIPAPGERIKELELAGAVYSAADGVSVYFANKVRNSESHIYYLAFGSILSLNFINFWHFAPWFYFAITIVMAALAGRIHRLSVNNRYVEYRGLAEAMRTLYFWRAAGVTRWAWVSCLSRQRGVVHWIAQAVRSIEFCQGSTLQTSSSGGVEIAKKHWVNNQREWLLGRELHHLNKFKHGNLIARWSIFCSFLTAGIIVFLSITSNGHGQLLWDDWVKPDKFGAFWQLALGLFALLELSGRDNRVHLELTKQYASQRDVFETAYFQLNAIERGAKSTWTEPQVLEQLGKETLQGQAEWLSREHTEPFQQPVPPPAA